MSSPEPENITTTVFDSNAMPFTCCIRDSDYINLRCEKYYLNGCFTPLQEIVSANVMIASFLALGLALFEVDRSKYLSYFATN